MEGDEGTLLKTGDIYRQVRIGKNGKPFVLLKFRTMSGNRVTRPFLRRTGLDELPQFVNVLRGEMALFGPRPEVPERDAHYRELIPEWAERDRAKPGLLGLAQITGCVRGNDRFSLERKREQAILDAAMIRSFESPLRGLLTRLWILSRLPIVMLFGGQTA